MAKNDNLTDFLTNVADAIRYKKNTSEKINPQDFFTQIVTIGSEGGDSGDSGVTPNAVRFLDCDGTLLHSYSADDFLTLTDLPELPAREGLICQEWNWNIADAQSFVIKYRKLDIGATYITDDGKTRLYIKIAAEGRMTVPLCFSQTVANGVTIDWGDGSATQTLSGTGNVNTTHTYADVGEYTISLNPSSGCTLGLGHNSSYCVIGSTGADGRVYCNMLQAVEIGKNVTSIGIYAFYRCYSLSSVVIPSGITSIGTYAFGYCYFLSSVVIPQGVTSFGTHVFYRCYSLSSVMIPQSVTSIGDSVFSECCSLASVVISNGVTSIGTNAFFECRSLSSVVIPQSVTSIGTYAFYRCYSLSSVVIPQSVTSIGIYAFFECGSLSSVVIPSGITSIGNNAFSGCLSLASIVIPDSVTSIGDSAFYNCYGMAFYDFRASKSVPTLSNTYAFNNIPSDCKIIVPDTLYDDWIAAENWSTYASYIIKKSEWDAQ